MCIAACILILTELLRAVSQTLNYKYMPWKKYKYTTAIAHMQFTWTNVQEQLAQDEPARLDKEKERTVSDQTYVCTSS